MSKPLSSQRHKKPEYALKGQVPSQCQFRNTCSTYKQHPMCSITNKVENETNPYGIILLYSNTLNFGGRGDFQACSEHSAQSHTTFVGGGGGGGFLK